MWGCVEKYLQRLLMIDQSKVEAWYDTNAELEERRLDEGRLEFDVTMRVIQSCISKLQLREARILDVGGGPGRYGRLASPLDCPSSPPIKQR